MLSILIPAYNYMPTQLLESLLEQLPADAELVVGDDQSKKTEVAMSLKAFCEERGIRFVQPTHNLGSAGMRNMLCREAKGEYLLYIDCDAIITDKDFVQKYVEKVNEATSQQGNEATSQQDNNYIVCGTIKHPDTMPSPQQSLRWKYEKSMEKCFTADLCNEHPYEHFRTSHFLVPKALMSRIPFDEGIKSSGYEDLLFGKRLQEQGVKVLHTDICVVNGDIEDNDTFLKKTERQLRTLYQFREELKEYSTLQKFSERLQRKHLLGFARLLYKLFKKPIRRHLLGSNPNIKLFQFYKLGYFEELRKS